MTSPSVTIVVVPRERFSHAQRSLECVYRNSDYPFDLVYVDGKSPAYVSQYLQRASAEKHFRLVRTERFLSPNEARNIGAKEVASKYVVFLDNDVHVAPGWLSKLVACAEETGAWAVAPLYFEGVPGDKIIHMAGGKATLAEADGVRTFDEEHVLHGHRLDEVSSSVRQTEVDFFEFHGVLMRLEAFKRLGPLDERYLSNHEHLDMSLLIKQAGGRIYLAPESHVTYEHGLLDDFDLEYASLRWSDEWNRQSTQHFLEKWNIGVNGSWGTSVLNWGSSHRQSLMRQKRNLKNIVKRHAARNILTRRIYAMLRDAR